MDGPQVFKKLKPFMDEILMDSELGCTEVTVNCRSLLPTEALGDPGRNDFPLQKGKEKLMQAEIGGSIGQAYTDRPGPFSGTVKEALTLPPVDNYRRAVIIAVLNAVCRKAGKTACTVHCRDKGPGQCGQQLKDYIEQTYGKPHIAVIGLQPALVEQLAAHFSTRVFDLDTDNIGRDKYGVTVESGEFDLVDLEKWADLFFVTGSTLVNGTIDPYLHLQKPVVFYGTTIAAAATLLGLNRFCPVSS